MRCQSFFQVNEWFEKLDTCTFGTVSEKNPTFAVAAIQMQALSKNSPRDPEDIRAGHFCLHMRKSFGRGAQPSLLIDCVTIHGT
ncbi:hypothetical protein KIN20_028144 [Parelaphostrongylus tenuis]|uniref:Uncharacterized protein n=1 Tax=Parelaphostrongylus tenuis TaxID=148309 RepID=A0AAD5WER6_PARTN|nr:hypothetical protein KIN20_028144 [Parelaphostrongylus tenuis]